MPALAQQELACGDIAQGFFAPEDSDVFRIDLAAGSRGFIQGSFTSGDSGDTLRIRVSGGVRYVETCSNLAEFESKGTPLTVEVSPCMGGSGDYVINFGVTSSSSDNCGFPLRCGATPEGIGLDALGEVDTFRFPGLAGGVVGLRIDDADERVDAYLMRVFDPQGKQIARVCSDSLEVSTSSNANYTVLVSACGELEVGDYRLERFDARCPQGPVITSMAFLPESGRLVLPVGYDVFGRPIFESSGRGTLVVEGRAGVSFRPVGGSAFERGALPDFQAILSRPLGDGNPAVCDQNVGGGIPATAPFGFRADAASIDRINDLGCRVENGQGLPVGRRDPLNSCENSMFSGFIDPTTAIQFCAPIPFASVFPGGDTLVAARLSDLDGVLGAVREMVVRVDEVSLPTATPTPTMVPPTPTRRPPTHTPTHTPTRSPTKPPVTRPPGPCTCDCNSNGRVGIAELTRSVRIALEISPITLCRAADRDGDGRVMISELVEGVNNALLGCPPDPIVD